MAPGHLEERFRLSESNIPLRLEKGLEPSQSDGHHGAEVQITLLSIRSQKFICSSAPADLGELREALSQRCEELHWDKRLCRPRHRGIQLSEMCGETGSGSTADGLIS